LLTYKNISYYHYLKYVSNGEITLILSSSSNESNIFMQINMGYHF